MAEFSRRLAIYLALASLLFASGDIWPVLTIGFNFRLSQLLMMLSFVLLLPSMARNGVAGFPGISWICGWVVWCFITLPFSLFPTRSVGYLFWLMTNVLSIFLLTQLFRTPGDVQKLLKAYLASFVALALFGVAQFALGVLGIGVLTTQWWIEGVLPRVNGLSYEPSYYATYLLPGWVTVAYLLEKGTTLLSRRFLLLVLASTTVALMLSTSRMGWLCMGAWLGFRAIAAMLRFLAGDPVSRKVIASIALAVIICAAALLTPAGSSLVAGASDIFSTLSFLLAGLGLMDGSDHSSSERIQGFVMTWQAFLNHPWVGAGLGAVSVEIGAMSGREIASLEDAKLNEGMSVALELLASVGVTGTFLVLIFAACVVRTAVKVVSCSDNAHRQLVLGLGWGLLWLVLILQFNQNFLRLYLWLDTAVLIAVLALLRRSPDSLGCQHAPDPSGA